jgi:hypothetical protein
MPKVKTSSSIVASSARGLSGCDSSVEVEMRRAEGEVQGLIVEIQQLSNQLTVS